MENWHDVITLLLVMALWRWHSYKIAMLEMQICQMGIKLHEASDEVFRTHMMREISHVLSEDDKAREKEGLPPFSKGG